MIKFQSAIFLYITDEDEIMESENEQKIEANNNNHQQWHEHQLPEQEQDFEVLNNILEHDPPANEEKDDDDPEIDLDVNGDPEDYFSIYERLCEAWMVTELEHTVSKVASDAL